MPQMRSPVHHIYPKISASFSRCGMARLLTTICPRPGSPGGERLAIATRMCPIGLGERGSHLRAVIQVLRAVMSAPTEPLPGFPASLLRETALPRITWAMQLRLPVLLNLAPAGPLGPLIWSGTKPPLVWASWSGSKRTERNRGRCGGPGFFSVRETKHLPVIADGAEICLPRLAARGPRFTPGSTCPLGCPWDFAVPSLAIPGFAWTLKCDRMTPLLNLVGWLRR